MRRLRARVASLVGVVGLLLAAPGSAHASVLRFDVPVEITNLFPEVKRVQISCAALRSDGVVVWSTFVNRVPVNGALKETFTFTSDLSESATLNAATWACSFALYASDPPIVGESALQVGPGVTDVLGRSAPATPLVLQSSGPL